MFKNQDIVIDRGGPHRLKGTDCHPDTDFDGKGNRRHKIYKCFEIKRWKQLLMTDRTNFFLLEPLTEITFGYY